MDGVREDTRRDIVKRYREKVENVMNYLNDVLHSYAQSIGDHLTFGKPSIFRELSTLSIQDFSHSCAPNPVSQT
jgi:hypothetical protein